MGFTRKPLSPSEKSKKITKLSPADYDLVSYLMATCRARDAILDVNDWSLQPDSRRRIINKIIDTLKRHLPFSGLEGLYELEKIATRFEEKVYRSAQSQPDYLRKISRKIMAIESNSQNSMPYLFPLNAGTSNSLPNSG